MIIPPAKKTYSTKRLLLFSTIAIVLIADFVISLWFFLPTFKKTVLTEYYKRRYPTIPSSEFREGTKFNYSKVNDTTTIGTYTGKLIQSKGVMTTINEPNGNMLTVYNGRVSSIPIELWVQELGSTDSANLLDNELAISEKYRKVGIQLEDEYKILTIPPDTVIQKPNWKSVNGKIIGDLTRFDEVGFNDITIGDYIAYQDTTPPQLFIVPSR